MVFSSVLFLFLFLPAVLTVYLGLTLGLEAAGRPHAAIKAGNLFLLFVSLVFYAWGEPVLVAVMFVSILVDFVAALVISGAWWASGEPPQLRVGGGRSRAQRLALVASLTCNLLLLGFFKYFNFGMENLRALAGLLGVDWLAWAGTFRVALPVGISFYTFQSMSYTIDVYRGEARATRSLLDFACFVTLFPQLVAGPIVRYRDLAAQLVSRRVTSEGFASGVRRFVLGLAKKVLVANSVAGAADAIFGLPLEQLTPGLAWLAVACYTIQIYFDFSGYSDMAIGLGRMLGFEFLENFNYPYVSLSIQEFWRRWHISLSSWFRDYLYIPLGGSRGTPSRTYANLVTVFFLCGLWHGASWTFVVWGFWHGGLQLFERGAFGRWLSRRWVPVRHGYVLLAAMVGWVLFRAETLTQAAAFLSAMVFMPPSDTAAGYVGFYLRSDVAAALLAGAVLATPVVPAARAWWRRSVAALRPGRLEPLLATTRLTGEAAALSVLFLLSAISLASGTHNPFIYYRF